MSYFHMGSPTLSSALNGFTSEFGMDSGGAHSLWSPDKLVGKRGQIIPSSIFQIRKVEIGFCVHLQSARQNI
jgi:hypothetical protein